VVAGRRVVAVLAAGAGALVAVSTVGSVALAQQTDVPEGNDDAALVARLDVLEADLPADPAPTRVDLDQTGDEGESTWGSFEGDVTGAGAVIDTLEVDLLGLYVDGDDAGTAVGGAVAAVARGWLDLGEAYDRLAAWEAHDIAFPIDAADDADTATDADELRGPAEMGLRLALGGWQRHLEGYVALRELAPAEPAAQVRLDTRADAAEVFDAELRPLLHRLMSWPTSQVLAPVERFATAAPGVDARARSLTVTCVETDAAGDVTAQTLDTGSEDGADVGTAEEPTTAHAPRTRRDCPDLASELRVTRP
jgi:hypothetical protein